MRKVILSVVFALGLTTPAHGEVVAQSASGFVITASAEVTASQEQAWRELIAPARWWSKDHTYSHDAANLTLDPRPGGCF
jgi:hypothetical protein